MSKYLLSILSYCTRACKKHQLITQAFQAIDNDDVDTLQDLLDQGLDPNARKTGPNGWTLLCYAISYGTRNRQRNPNALYSNIALPRSSIINTLLKSPSIDTNLTSNISNSLTQSMIRSPLQLAKAQKNARSIYDALIAYGAHSDENEKLNLKHEL